MATQPPPLKDMHDGPTITEYQARAKNGHTIRSTFESVEGLKRFIEAQAERGVPLRAFAVRTRVTEFKF